MKIITVILAGVATVLIMIGAGSAAASVDGTAVKNPAVRYSDTLPACQEEDGSGVGQAFPCLWDGGSNGEGDDYVLFGPLNGV
jgi:hypothetical protein